MDADNCLQPLMTSTIFDVPALDVAKVNLKVSTGLRTPIHPPPPSHTCRKCKQVMLLVGYCLQKLLARTPDSLHLELGHSRHQSSGVCVVTMIIQTTVKTLLRQKKVVIKPIWTVLQHCSSIP